jgi:predicted AlkP superfamily pyrophosphatase or phosphodiesterase
MRRTFMRLLPVVLLPSLVFGVVSTDVSGTDGRKPSGPDRAAFLERFARAYYPGRSGQILVVPREGHIITRRDPTVKYMHGSPWTYDTRIPFLLYGPTFVRKGTFVQPVTQKDMAPTLAALLGVPMPGTSSGRSLRTILEPAAPRPRLIMLAVLDGMRLDYFDRYATVMPTLDRLRRQGAWFSNARIDYLPSITSVAHATIATGADARVHGIVGNAFFDRIAGSATDSYPGLSPRYLMAPTLSDVWNLHTDGLAVIIGQGSVGRAALPLAGHGACQLNGHRVVAVSYSTESGGWETNPECYRLPDYLKEANARTLWEGHGGAWMGHSIASPADVRGSALFSTFETNALNLMIEREPIGSDDVTDLLFVNLKTPDYVGHRYGPDSPELRESLAALDRDLSRVLAALDTRLGRDQYVIAVTADHGMPPEPDTRTGGERHYAEDLTKSIHQRFDPEQSALVKHYEAENCQIAIDRRRLRELGLDLDAIARFLEAQPFVLAAYTEQEVARAAAALGPVPARNQAR